MARIYTRSGDKGTTSLIYGKRVSKSDIRVEAYGTCDEANSMIGLALSYLDSIDFADKPAFLSLFHEIQTILFHAGSELATPEGKEVLWAVKSEHITKLENRIDYYEEKLQPLKQFILPGGSPAGAALHVARTIVRRAERCAVAISEEVNPLALSYLNRLSDFLFVSGRYINHMLKKEEAVLHED
ncbi:cob(I)alamin adenosyltransferase [Pullulanibacillus pueri]|uniref:Corrinoid adenosyltransferase n=1 Tax=Pullulanibacillus pueri TaxID=1437324 RepID=A0A8J3ENT0_9BACL|nr:cob(I)yrinic acid a,c-diamide adenosyltransferase [Pullulanibacillus pueri]MBM7680688.1 cob(I)alamin adenosyltransferase [Pullulanibacillus pueri]GGH87508.1 ATP--cob(I)alamin adenosyltransferase [Pullulanibacillus pueri]